jgi:hypothetical protein
MIKALLYLLIDNARAESRDAARAAVTEAIHKAVAPFAFAVRVICVSLDRTVRVHGLLRCRLLLVALRRRGTLFLWLWKKLNNYVWTNMMVDIRRNPAAGKSPVVVGRSLIAVFQGCNDRELGHQGEEEMCLGRNYMTEWGRSWVEKSRDCWTMAERLGLQRTEAEGRMGLGWKPECTVAVNLTWVFIISGRYLQRDRRWFETGDKRQGDMIFDILQFMVYLIRS